MLKVEIDGQAVEVAPGTMVMEAATRLGLYVPHFCYHHKLSIAANCRMCLVDVEKAPKPLPACATPVTDGMKVQTHSAKARQAQNGVMEFLLINHPLDCPICDQGGECQLQDLAVGYGGSASRFDEEKRVVGSKDVGPLVSAEEMSRCIQCTRCVRFGQEVAGVMELGMIGRGEHSEIVAFVGQSVDSELSGNMIDICPVGALTSKPFRYSARTWELSRRKTIAAHDSLGSNLITQVKQNRVMRVVPLENEAINECWLSDRDRFSYLGLNHSDRLTRPMVRTAQGWVETDWQSALEKAVAGLKSVIDGHGAVALGALASPQATLEELWLLQALMRALGSGNIDFRLRQVDFRADAYATGVPWLGLPVSALSELDRVLVIGSFLRKDHPLIAQRLRQASRRGEVNLLQVCDDDPLMRVAHRVTVAPSRLAESLAQVVRAVAEALDQPVPPEAALVTVGPAARAMATSLIGGERRAILLGSVVNAIGCRTEIVVLTQRLGTLLGAPWGFLGEGANAVGGHVAGAIPHGSGLDARAMLVQPRKGYLLFGLEPELDCADPALARAALASADFVLAFSAYAPRAGDRADVVLPIAPFTETPGSFVNAEGRLQSFSAVVHPLGEARPGWKVLRVLATMLGQSTLAFETIESVRAMLPAPESLPGRLGNALDGGNWPVAVRAGGEPAAIERIGEVPIYAVDPIVRRAGALQKTRDAIEPRLRACAATLTLLGLSHGAHARVSQGGEPIVLEVMLDPTVPPGCVRVAAAHAATATLGAMYDEVRVEAA
jgi:NADH-quinone oxidoreductase subunit G